jgi:hypothetical protein
VKTLPPIRGIEFEILVFRSHRELKKFVTTSDSLLTAGLSRRILSSKVLLITKNEGVAAESWGQYRDTGFRSVCGDCSPCWHQTEELHDELRTALDQHHAPYIEVFRGEHVVIVYPDSVPRGPLNVGGERS